MAGNPADKYARKTFGQLESQMSRQYREAYRDVSKKLQDFTRRHKAKDKQMQRDLKKGKITQEQYASWLRGQVFMGQQWQDTKASLDLSIKNVMTETAHLTHQKSIDVFVDNANYTAYQIEKDHGFTGGINFTMYDRKTVSRLMLEDPELLPRGRDINGNKLSAWNTKVIANCVTQSILQGESIDELSKRIARDTCIDAGRSSLLYARTAMTGAQNAGRVERMKEAEEMGIKVQKQWMSTLDSRTRDTHRDMDGEIADTDEEFSNGLEYPGDPSGDPREVYNCRCTLIYHYPEYSDYSKMERTAYYEEGDPEYDPDHRNYETVKGMNYEQWVNYKQDQIRQRYNPRMEDITEPEENEFIKRLQSEGMTKEDARMVYDTIQSAKSIDEIEWLTGDFFTYDELEEMWEEKQTWDQEESKPEETIEEMVGRLKKVDINEDWYYQPEPGQEKDMRENLIPFVGVGRDMELDEKLDFGLNTEIVSTRYDVPVRIADLKTLQPMVDIRGVERALHDQAGMGNPIKVVEYNGQMYVLDGNHRVNAAILRGDETINVQLIERVDKQLPSPELAEPATLKNLPQYTDTYLDKHAKDTGLTEDQRKELRDMLREMYGNSDTYSFVSSDAVLDIADGGHMKNYFERAGRQISANEEKLRVKVSDTLFGVDTKNIDPTQYEKYGFMGSSDTTKMLTMSSADKYGDFCIKFNKNSLSDRLTYTFGDSLINIDTNRTLIAGRVGSDTNIAGVSLDRMPSSYKKMKSLQKSGQLNATDVAAKCVGKTGYVEAQIHGMITKSDVSEVWVKCRWNGRQWEQRSNSYDLDTIRQKLDDNGIKMHRYGIKMEQDPDTKKWVERVVVIE